MKYIFVAVPSKYRLNEEETDALTTRINHLKRKAEQLVGEKCITVMHYSYYFTEKTFQSLNYQNEETAMLDFLEAAIGLLCQADFSVFTFDWQTSRECRILHKVADECGVIPLVFKEEALS